MIKQVRIFAGVFCTIGLLAMGLFLLPFPSKSLPTSTAQAKSAPPQYAKWHYWDSTRHVAQYNLACRSVLEVQDELAKAYAEAEESEKKYVREQAKEAIFDAVTQKLLPFWNETEWDFNGTTHSPTQGVIACGYFVATILQHAGIELDRPKMGQSSSSNLVKALCDTNTVQIFQNKNFKGLWQYLSKKAPDGLYIVGMDRHAGMIAKQKGKVTFIHSRKPRLAGVIFENAEKSLTLQNSKIHVVGNVLANDALVRRWLGE
ncbi:MAG: hypothetical protein EAZ95_01730 [Bacteroidetes bacterium]|nr:MAG: hypothetical protein EAZ95_01730 [Bacteroidota bacterium]